MKCYTISSFKYFWEDITHKPVGVEAEAGLIQSFGFNTDLYVGGLDVPTYFEQVGDNKFVIYEPIRDRGRYKRTTLNNPDLRTWRNFLGYAKGGPVDKPLYDDQRMI